MRIALVLSGILLWGCDYGAWAGEVTFQRVQLDARFRSEGAAAADFNNDGHVDIVAGDLWYEAPGWTPHEIRKPGDYWAGVGYSNSFCNWTYDINQDGWSDVIIVGFPGEPFHWYENPHNSTDPWSEHVIWHSICNETPQFRDVTGDCRPDVVLGSQPESQMGYLEIPTGDAVFQKWTFTPVSAPGTPGENGTFRYYHGLGVTDVNGDGRADVVIPHGWWEAPAEINGEPWTFHVHRLASSPNTGPLTGADIYADDLDLDGDQDLLMSCAHAYGVWWFENVSTPEAAAYKFHVIDESYSQTHALHFVDINGDGQRDLVTGKRFFAHNGGDPGAYEPVSMYWYEVTRSAGAPPQFVKHEILEGRDTGVGTQFTVADVDGDQLPDIVLSNKKGVNLLLQRRK